MLGMPRRRVDAATLHATSRHPARQPYRPACAIRAPPDHRDSASPGFRSRSAPVSDLWFVIPLSRASGGVRRRDGVRRERRRSAARAALDRGCRCTRSRSPWPSGRARSSRSDSSRSGRRSTTCSTRGTTPRSAPSDRSPPDGSRARPGGDRHGRRAARCAGRRVTFGDGGLLLAALAAAGILFYNAAGKHVPAVGLITIGTSTPHMAIPNDRPRLPLPIWLVVSHAIAVAIGVYILEGKATVASPRSMVAVAIRIPLLVDDHPRRRRGPRRVHGLWPAEVPIIGLVWPLLAVVSFAVVAAQDRGRDRPRRR